MTQWGSKFRGAARMAAPLSLLLSLPWFCAGAGAAGYGTREFSAIAMGQAYAGSSATDSDPSFMGYNPAALDGVRSWDTTVGFIAALPTSDAHYTVAQNFAAVPIGGARDQHGFVDPAYVPNLAARYRLSEQWAIGLSVVAPWGLSTSYDKSWAGRYQALDTKLVTINAAPTIGFQPNDRLSLAVALQIQYATGKLSNAIDIGTIGGGIPTMQDGYGEFRADDLAFGFTLGAIWRPTDDVRLGLSYRSQIKHRLTGPVDFTLDSAGIGTVLQGSGLLKNTHAATNLTTPQTVSFGAVVDVSPDVSLSGELGWTNWRVFSDLRVEFDNPAQPDDVTPFGWKDSWFGALGASYRPSRDWTLRMGAAYDQSPARDSTRNARIPDADRIWLSLGADVALTERTSLSFSLAHLFLPRGEVNLSSTDPANLLRGDLVGTTDAEANALALQLTFR
jgi:long-chain fatty acid transport protein